MIPPKKKKIKKLKSSATSGANAPLLRHGGGASQDGKDQRFKCSARIISESARPFSAMESRPLSDNPSLLEGPKVKVVLITEGLGNRRDMNYYGPEAMDSAPAVFEGAHCFLNHPSYTEERDIPERRVQDMAGYFKNVQVEVMEGIRSVTGELHFDLSDTGRMAYQKTLTALHYATEFPGSDKEYVGLSVNANGASEEKEINLDGENTTVNYVTQFTEAMSCDVVTLPARGGKFLALVESAAGANMKNKEVRTMVVKRLQAAQSALKEAATIEDRAKREAKTREAQKEIDALLKDVLESAGKTKKTKEADSEEADEAESEEAEADEAEDTSAGPVTTVTKKHHVTITKKGAGAAAAGDDDADAEEADAEAEEADDMESEKMESNRLAVKQLIQESGLKPGYFDVEELARKGLREAKRELARVKRVSETNAKEMKAVLSQVMPSHAAKLNESGRSGEKSGSNYDCFADCSL